MPRNTFFSGRGKGAGRTAAMNERRALLRERRIRDLEQVIDSLTRRCAESQDAQLQAWRDDLKEVLSFLRTAR